MTRMEMTEIIMDAMQECYGDEFKPLATKTFIDTKDDDYLLRMCEQIDIYGCEILKHID